MQLTLLASLMIFVASCDTIHVKQKETCVWSDQDKTLGCDDPRLSDELRKYFRDMEDADVCTNMDDYLDTQREVLKLIEIVESQSNCK